MTVAERRSCERLSLEALVMVSMSGEKGKTTSYNMMTRDICSGGAFLRTETPLEVGTHVKLGIVLSIMKNLPEKEKKRTCIDVSGSVIRIEEIGMAVCFNKQYRISPYKS